MCVSACTYTVTTWSKLDFYHHGNNMLHGINKDDSPTCKIKTKNNPYKTIPNKAKITVASRYDGIALSSDKYYYKTGM